VQQHWSLIITNHGQILSKQEMALLSRLVHSHHGHGVGAVLTNATIEKFFGEVKWEQHDDVMITTILLPVSTKHANSDSH
jgi:two-component system sensor histidine kinase RegB